ncbi:hypothetical protein [Aliiglaciecola sp. 3_MG-2023]|uniref:hypothetical protein n=1 Tax=Aliiglaciecola sp. 3_MG-2023 TaxID=3062644 RepID=UPI0026E1DE65|nr:hypothetical protein [Aliiglaciecola sp. 3_MG-2023]
MRISNFGETCLAISGVWLIASSMPDFLTSIITIKTSNLIADEGSFYFGTLVFLITKLVIGLFLIATRKSIGKFLGFNSQFDSNATELLSAAIFLLGLYFIFNGSVALGQHYLVFREQSDTEMYYFWQGLLSIICGLTLSLFSFSLSKIWRLLRFAGT